MDCVTWALDLKAVAGIASAREPSQCGVLPLLHVWVAQVQLAKFEMKGEAFQPKAKKPVSKKERKVWDVECTAHVGKWTAHITQVTHGYRCPFSCCQLFALFVCKM